MHLIFMTFLLSEETSVIAFLFFRKNNTFPKWCYSEIAKKKSFRLESFPLKIEL